MKWRMMVLLVLLAAVVGSATVETLSLFQSTASFGTSITPDMLRIQEQRLDSGAQEADPSIQSETEDVLREEPQQAQEAAENLSE